MNPEFALWLNGFLEILSIILCYVMSGAAIICTIIFIFLAIKMQEQERK